MRQFMEKPTVRAASASVIEIYATEKKRQGLLRRAEDRSFPYPARRWCVLAQQRGFVVGRGVALRGLMCIVFEGRHQLC